jgi:hypothetical protein
VRPWWIQKPLQRRRLHHWCLQMFLVQSLIWIWMTTITSPLFHFIHINHVNRINHINQQQQGYKM